MKEFSPVVFSVLTMVAFYALWHGKLNAFGLSATLIAIAVACFIIFTDGVEKLVAKIGNTEVTAEVRKIQQDIYAKVATVQKIGEETAELVAFTALQVGRFAPTDLQEQLITNRDRIVAILREIGSDQKKIEVINNRFNERIRGDLKNEVVRKAEAAIVASIASRQTSGEQLSFDRNALHEELTRTLRDYQGTRQEQEILMSYLSERGGLNDETRAALGRLNVFLNEGRLISQK